MNNFFLFYIKNSSMPSETYYSPGDMLNSAQNKAKSYLYVLK